MFFWKITCVNLKGDDAAMKKSRFWSGGFIFLRAGFECDEGVSVESTGGRFLALCVAHALLGQQVSGCAWY